MYSVCSSSTAIDRCHELQTCQGIISRRDKRSRYSRDTQQCEHSMNTNDCCLMCGCLFPSSVCRCLLTFPAASYTVHFHPSTFSVMSPPNQLLTGVKSRSRIFRRPLPTPLRGHKNEHNKVAVSYTTTDMCLYRHAGMHSSKLSFTR